MHFTKKAGFAKKTETLRKKKNMSENKQAKKDILRTFEARQLKTIPTLKVGDTVRVHAKIKEGDKERIQLFEGVLMRYQKGSVNATITVRKISFGVGVERVFPLHAPTVEKVEKLSEGKVRQSRLYYLRKLRGRAARIEQWKDFEGATTQSENVVEKMGTVATGPVISSSDTVEEKKEEAKVLETADSKRKN
ncbi:MAG: 50S ribosomal protein L19 [Deltaproteobacteria bacterium RIFCSPHIGHO2_02_FULL_40_11]|nr:MAG: 50S ribosomal protein L19 [Deltaproteobacteria bacterium RIFCSPHIGHO2_02_FULL_40_11]